MPWAELRPVRWAPSFSIELLIVAGLMVACWHWGVYSERQDAQRSLQEAQGRFVQESLRAGQAEQEFVSQRSALQARYTSLQEKFDELAARRVPLARVRSPATQVLACAGLGPVAGAATATGTGTGTSPGTGTVPVPPPPDPQPLQDAAPADPGIDLTTGAVWLWNSALRGADAPAGACSAVDTAAEACGVAAGLTLEDAWRNHAENAQSCAEDRLRQQRLIDYLKAREGRDGR